MWPNGLLGQLVEVPHVWSSLVPDRRSGIMILRPRVLTLVLSGLMSVAGLAITTSATADSADATVIDLPVGLRATPRGVWPIGQTDDGDTVINAELDPFGSGGGLGEYRIVSAGGTVEALDSAVESVVGNRLVRSHNDTSVTSRVVSVSTWSTQTVPAGHTVLDYTADGIVVRTGSAGAHQLGLVPWGSTSVLTIAGVPEGASVYPYLHGVHDGSWSVFSAGFSGGGTGKVVVDTSSRRAWPMQANAGNCPSTGSSGLAVNEGVLAWYAQLADLSKVVCTTLLPGPADPLVPATTERPLGALPPVPGTPQDYQLLPVGSDVLVSLPDAVRTWGTSTGEPVLAIAPNGTARTLAQSGHGVVPAASGHVIAVTGTQPGQASLRDVTVSSGTSDEVMPIQPVGAWYTSIAVDGSTVAYSDDSAALGGARQRTVDFTSGDAGSTTLLDEDVTGPIATGQGVTAWGKSGYQGKWSTVLQADGTRITSNSYKPRWAETGWVRFAGEVMRLPAGTRSPLANMVAFQDGVTYVPGGTVSGAAANDVVATDLVTGATSTIAVPECSSVGDIQVAGSWLLVICPTSPTALKMVAVDRTGVVPTRTISTGGKVYLGNGFALLRSGSDIWWASLSAPSMAWTHLGTATDSGDEAPHAVAVSRGATPSAAWFSGRSAHVALFPVPTSSLPPHPALAAPPAPTSLQVAVDPVTGEATASWSWTAAPGAEQAVSFSVDSGDIHVSGLPATARSASLGVPPAGTRPVQVVVHGPSESSTAQLASVTFPGGPNYSPSSLAYGALEVGATSASQSVTVTNTGSDPLAIGTAAFGGSAASSFVKVSDGCSNTTVPVGGSCQVAVQFRPAAVGALAATLAIPNSSPSTPHVVSLTGLGTPPADLKVLGIGSVYSGRNHLVTRTVTASGKVMTYTLGVLNEDAVARSYKLELTPSGSAATAAVHASGFNGAVLPTDGSGRFITPTVAAGKVLTLVLKVSPTAPGQHISRVDVDLLTDFGALIEGVATETNTPAPAAGVSSHDLFVKQGSQPFVGGPVDDQTASSPALNVGQSAIYTLRLKNDGAGSHSIGLKITDVDGCAGSFTTAVKVGTKIWTSEAFAGTYVTPVRAPGQYTTVTVTVKRALAGCAMQKLRVQSLDGGVPVQSSYLLANAAYSASAD